MIQPIIYTSDFKKEIIAILSDYNDKELNLMISGGSILPLLEVTKIFKTKKWRIYYCDERVSTYKSDLNYLQALPYISDISNFPIFTDKFTPEECIKNYQIPPIDLALLGVGEDGHIASLQPMSLYLESKEDLLYVENFPNQPKQRITVSITFLNKIKKIFFLIPPKNGIIKNIKEPHPSILSKLSSDISIILDSRCEM